MVKSLFFLMGRLRFSSPLLRPFFHLIVLRWRGIGLTRVGDRRPTPYVNYRQTCAKDGRVSHSYNSQLLCFYEDVKRRRDLEERASRKGDEERRRMGGRDGFGAPAGKVRGVGLD